MRCTVRVTAIRVTALFAALSAGCLSATTSSAVAMGRQATHGSSFSSASVHRSVPLPGDLSSNNDGFIERDLVSDLAGRAEVQDKNLVNSWGMSAAPGGPIWVSDNGTNLATVYAGAQAGRPVRVLSTVVSIPGQGAPTGQVFNDTHSFTIRASSKGKRRPATYIFAGEEGNISGWNPEVSETDAILTVTTPNAVYKGIALVHTSSGPRLLAANFRAGRVDIFDGRFKLLVPHGRFEDETIPDGFAPFNVAVIGGHVFVSYAKQDPAKHDDVAGPGNGFINEFDRNGRLLRRFASNGVLNSPWGMLQAPPDFGKFSDDLLVGNFGDGTINVFDLDSGRLKGHLSRPDGTPIVIDGLWGLQRGTTAAGGRQVVWFAAGIEKEAHGLLGTLRAD